MFARTLRSFRFNTRKYGSTAPSSTFVKAPESAQRSRLTATAYTASAVSAGLATWYFYLYGHPASAMTLAEEGLHSPKHPWYHNSPFHTFDHERLVFELSRLMVVFEEVIKFIVKVYIIILFLIQVCAACHSLDRIAWRNLVGVSHTVDEVKAMAEEVEYQDGPDDNGDMFQRPGKLSDYMPAPYANEEAARAGNAGALPPDLSLIVKARHGGADYIFSLITGYVDPPAGFHLQEGMHFNPYFPGLSIAMARALYDGVVEYEDTSIPATTTQMAKDVVTFLNWAAEPEHDQRKRMGLQAVIVLSTMFALSLWVKRW